MHFSLEQLNAFLATQDTGSFSAAARKLGKAQSVVSTAIANLEIDLGVNLFDRQGRYPQLTPAGERLVPEARKIMEACQHFQSLAGEMAAGVEQRLTLAVDDESNLPWLEPVLAELSRRFPTVQLELLFPSMGDLIEMLLRGRAQLGIGYEDQLSNDGIARHPMGLVKAHICAHPKHPLASQQRVSIADLAAVRQIALTSRSGTTTQHELLSSDVWWAEGDLVILALIKYGHGWGVLPAFLTDEAIRNGEIVVLKPDFQMKFSQFRREVLWHRPVAQGPVGSWLKETLMTLPQVAFEPVSR